MPLHAGSLPAGEVSGPRGACQSLHCSMCTELLPRWQRLEGSTALQQGLMSLVSAKPGLTLVCSRFRQWSC